MIAILKTMFGMSTVRGLLGALLALTIFVVGTTNSAQASVMAAKMAATIDISMPDDCNDCNGDESSAMACFAICSGIPAATLVVSVIIPFIASARPSSPFVASVADHCRPPDPYPPRLTA